MIHYSEDAQGQQDPDKLPKSLSFFFLFPLETRRRRVSKHSGRFRAIKWHQYTWGQLLCQELSSNFLRRTFFA